MMKVSLTNDDLLSQDHWIIPVMCRLTGSMPLKRGSSVIQLVLYGRKKCRRSGIWFSISSPRMTGNVLLSGTISGFPLPETAGLR